MFGYVATYPSAGGRREGSQVCLPREEGARSHHQRLFEENVEKTGTCDLQTLIVKGSGVGFKHAEGISTSRVRHKGRQPLIECAKHDFKTTYFPLFYVFMYFFSFFMFLCFLWAFCIFLSFCGRQGCFPRSYVSLIAMRKSDLQRWLSCFYLLS
ncbi:hypothetical protein AAZX31_19G063400 [Glycine max]